MQELDLTPKNKQDEVELRDHEEPERGNKQAREPSKGKGKRKETPEEVEKERANQSRNKLKAKTRKRLQERNDYPRG